MAEKSKNIHQSYGYYKQLLNVEDFSLLDNISCSDMGAFLVCTQGQMSISINTQDYILEPNSILTLMPNDIFITKECRENFNGHLIVFPSSFAGSVDLKEKLLFFVVQIKERPILHISSSNMALTLEYVTLLKSLYEKVDVISYPIIKGIIQSLLYVLYIGYSKTNATVLTRNSFNRKDIIFRDFIQLVGTYYMQERQVEFYADKLCITPKYLNLVVKVVYGHTPKYIIDRALILAAMAKLQTHEYTAQQIADMLGFANASSFGKFFKKHVGCSPGKYQSNGKTDFDNC